jgi:hypothetical protein
MRSESITDTKFLAAVTRSPKCRALAVPQANVHIDVSCPGRTDGTDELHGQRPGTWRPNCGAPGPRHLPAVLLRQFRRLSTLAGPPAGISLY